MQETTFAYMPRCIGRLLRTILARRGVAWTRMVGQGLGDVRLIRETRGRVALLMQDSAALQILACVRAVRGLDAAMAEAGVYAGGSARLICEAKGDRRLHLFDVFETLQNQTVPLDPRSADEEVRRHFGRVHGSRAAVERLLSGYPAVQVHSGLFPNSAAGLTTERFSFVHLDLDLESGTLAALRFFHPRVLPGGIIVGDDYQLPGVRRAFAAWFTGKADTLIELPWGQVLVIRSDRP